MTMGPRIQTSPRIPRGTSAVPASFMSLASQLATSSPTEEGALREDDPSMDGGGASGGNDVIVGDRFGGPGGREKVAPQVNLVCFVRGGLCTGGKRIAGRKSFRGKFWIFTRSFRSPG